MTCFFEFARDDAGAVTVDWVVLTAALVGLGMATMSVVSSGVEDLSGDINKELGRNDIIQTSFPVATSESKVKLKPVLKPQSEGKETDSFTVLNNEAFEDAVRESAEWKVETAKEGIRKRIDQAKAALSDGDETGAAKYLSNAAGYAERLKPGSEEHEQFSIAYDGLMSDYEKQFGTSEKKG